MGKESKRTTRPWSAAEEDWLFQNMYKKPMTELCTYLGRNENAVKLKMHRERQNPKSVVKDNVLLRILRTRFSDPSLFAPNKEFFRAVGIGQKRFWMIYKGLEKLTGEECQRVCRHLGLCYTDFVDSLQLTFEGGDFR